MEAASQYDEINSWKRPRYIEWQLPEEYRCTEETHYALLRNAVTKAAHRYAEEHELTHEEADELLHEAEEVLSEVELSLTGSSGLSVANRSQEVGYWQHWKDLPQRVLQERYPYIDRASIEGAVERYLNLPFRTQMLDRLFVDILIAMEFCAFADEMFNEEKNELFPPRSPLKQPHALWSFIKGQFQSGAVLFGLAAAFVYAGSEEWIGEGWAFGLAFAAVGIFALLFLLGAAFLPSVWIGQVRQRKKVRKLISDMAGIYADLGSKGPISARFIFERAKDVAASGAVWPSHLFVLLDDIMARNGRF